MSHPLPPELERLHAYIDGQLTPEARLAVEERLSGDRDAQTQVKDYQQQRLDLQRLYAPMLDEAVPKELAHWRPKRRLRWWRPVGTAAAALLLFAGGVLLGRVVSHLPGDDSPADLAGAPLVRDAVMAYTVYTPEVRHPVEVPGEQEQHLVAWLTNRLGARLDAPNLEPLGYQLVGGRLMATDDGPGAMLMYENDGGQRVVLYASRTLPDEPTTAFRYAERGPISIFYWIGGTLSYALAGELDRSGLLSIAKAVYQQSTG